VHFWILVVFVLSLCLLMLKVLLQEELKTRVFWLSLAHYRLQAYGCDSDFIMLFEAASPFWHAVSFDYNSMVPCL
jgi:hypothetical protein